MTSNSFSKSNREPNSLPPLSQRQGQNRLVASLTGRFLASGEVSAREKRPVRILGARGTHSATQQGGSAGAATPEERNREGEAALEGRSLGGGPR